jgi:DNA-binding NtrC family response regulator
LADAFGRYEVQEASGRTSCALADIFPHCAGGTVLLEELSGLSTANQSRLLGSLQRQAITTATDVRVILSTSIPGRQLLERGDLRSDLFYFLSPYTVRVPALRERDNDFELLVAHFMQRLVRVSATSEHHGPPRVSPAAMALLRRHNWPGNVAQLKSVLQSVLMESRGAVLATDALHRALDSGQELQPLLSASAGTEGLNGAWDIMGFVRDRLRDGTDHLYEDAVTHLEQTLLTLVLQHTHGNQAQAAKCLGMTRTSLRKKIAVAQIDLSRLSDPGLADGNGIALERP